LHLIYEHGSIIIKAEGDTIYIGTANREEYYVMEGDFIIDKDGIIRAYYGKGGDLIIPEKIAGINVRVIDLFYGQSIFHCENITSISLPSTINEAYIGSVPTVIIGSNVDIESIHGSGFEEAYNRNGKKGGTYTRNRGGDWAYKP
jgi:hypothetical protein